MKWLLSEGEAVTPQTLLFELETDKAIIDVPAPAEGVLLKIVTPAGLVSVETIVGWVGNPGETIPNGQKTVASIPGDREERPATSELPKHPGAAPSTPAARRRAQELGVDLATVTGSGPNGRVTQEDVERAANTKVEEPSPGQGRGELIRSLSHAWQTVPHIHISRRFDVGGLAELHRRLRPQNISLTDMLLFVLSRLLPSFPELTCLWEDNRLKPTSDLHISFAVDTESAVIAPVIRNISTLSLEQISERRQELTDAARRQRIKLVDLQNGVFTLTNLGMVGADFFAPIVAWPQTAILAVGRMTQEPVVRNGSLGIGWQMWANIALDHRAADGALGARFLSKLQDNLNELSKDFQTE